MTWPVSVAQMADSSGPVYGEELKRRDTDLLDKRKCPVYKIAAWVSGWKKPEVQGEGHRAVVNRRLRTMDSQGAALCLDVVTRGRTVACRRIRSGKSRRRVIPDLCASAGRVHF